MNAQYIIAKSVDCILLVQGEHNGAGNAVVRSIQLLDRKIDFILEVPHNNLVQRQVGNIEEHKREIVVVYICEERIYHLVVLRVDVNSCLKAIKRTSEEIVHRSIVYCIAHRIHSLNGVEYVFNVGFLCVPPSICFRVSGREAFNLVRAYAETHRAVEPLGHFIKIVELGRH